MARPGKSKNVLEASGAFVKKPKRGKEGTPAMPFVYAVAG